MSNRSINIGRPVNWAHPLNRGLVSWYLAMPNRNRGGKFFDLSGRNRGTLTGAPTWSGPVGRPGGFGCVSLNAVTSQEITVDEGAAVRPAFSVMYWFRTPGTLTSASNKTGVFAKETGGSGDSRGGMAQETNNTLQWYDGAATKTSSNSAWSVNTWCHAVFVGDGTNMTFYSNGRAWGSAASTNGIGAILALGTYFRAGFLGFKGDLDDYRVYSRALSAAEVAALYRDSRQGYPNTLNWIDYSRYAVQAAAATANPTYSIFKPAVIRAA